MKTGIGAISGLPLPLAPDVRDDPSYKRALEEHKGFAALAAHVRADKRRSPEGQDEVVSNAADASNDVIRDAATDLGGRRQRRFDHLAAQLPIGPNLPEGASATDSAVLHQLFRGASTAVAGMDPGQRQQTLTAAARDGDDTMLRALTTAALTEPDPDLMASLKSALPVQYGDASKALTEMDQLLSATSPTNLVAISFYAQVFRPVSEAVPPGQQNLAGGYYPPPPLSARLRIGNGATSRLAQASA